MARHGIGIAPLIQRSFGGDQTARLGGSFDHNDCLRQSRYQPIVHRKMTCLGLSAHGLFGNQQTIVTNLLRQLRVFSRVNNINPTAQYGNRSCADCRGMRRGQAPNKSHTPLPPI